MMEAVLALTRTADEAASAANDDVYDDRDFILLWFMCQKLMCSNVDVPCFLNEFKLQYFSIVSIVYG